jgi:hypothetical protein
MPLICLQYYVRASAAEQQLFCKGQVIQPELARWQGWTLVEHDATGERLRVHRVDGVARDISIL